MVGLLLRSRSTIGTAFAGWLVFGLGAAAGLPVDVSVTGGSDAVGQQYRWVVTNDGPSPIVAVEFPHFRAGLFFVPDGWTSDCTGLVGVGSKDEGGVCSARATSNGQNIVRGHSATFRMQISAKGAQRRRGAVSIEFADGRKASVSGVELPHAESAGDKLVPLLGLAAVVFVWVAFQTVRSRKRRNPGANAD